MSQYYSVYFLKFYNQNNQHVAVHIKQYFNIWCSPNPVRNENIDRPLTLIDLYVICDESLFLLDHIMCVCVYVCMYE